MFLDSSIKSAEVTKTDEEIKESFSLLVFCDCDSQF